MTASGAAPPRLAASGIHKRFGATIALAGADLTVAAGEVHAVLGENGAGKSTLMRILTGALAPDAGELRLDGAPFAPAGPRAARAAGVAIVHQEPSLCAHLTVAENVVLGTEPARRGLIRRAAARQAARDALALLGAAGGRIPLEAPVRALGPAEQQLVEIARALRHAAGGRVLILDEPTSALGQAEVATLFEVIAGLRASGLTILYISHHLDEVERVATRFTVLRDGRAAATGRVDRAALPEIIRAMTGRPPGELYPRGARSPGGPVLDVGADLTLRAGEVLGIAGLLGAGRTRLLRALFGLSGDGPPPRRRIAAGLGMLSEDRAGEGLALELSVGENLTMSRPVTRARGLMLSARGEAAAVRRWTARLAIKHAGPGERVRHLSGGNQQKVALGRLLHQGARVLLLDEPTRGVDIGSRAEIYRLVDELAAAGTAVLVTSSDLGELLGICDRIAVMCRGRLGPARAAADWTAPELLAEASAAGAS